METVNVEFEEIEDKKMQFRDLNRQYQKLQTEIDQGIAGVINTSAFISGKPVQELEERLAGYVGVKHCISCGNGTDALQLALMAWGIGEGDVVFVPDFTFFSSAEVVSAVGATPVFVDVNEHTFNLDAIKLKQAVERIAKKTKLMPRVIVAVDLFGLPADFDGIRDVADEYNLKILEDAAQGFGGSIRGKRACSFGDIATTSFFPAKPLGCYGDGGAIFTDDDGIAEQLRSLRIHGKGASKYDNVRIGMNSRLDTIQAAILLPKLNAFVEYELERVNEIAKQYTSLLNNMVVTPDIPDGRMSSWAQYTIRLNGADERNNLQTYLTSRDIPSMIYYQKGMHQQQAFEDVSGLSCDLEVTERLCGQVLSLPMHPYLEKDEIQRVADAIIDWKKNDEKNCQ